MDTTIMKVEARNTILLYADEEMQRNAALTGEYKEYVTLVLQLLRDDYREQVENGNTTYVVNERTLDFLDSIRPF
jgi:hypothetical protein